MRVFGYARVSTSEQGDSGLGLAAQRLAIHAECERKGWQLVEILEDVASGAHLARRPALSEALGRLADREADSLLVSKVDRLSRSLIDFAGLVDKAQSEGWTLAVLDLGVDTASPSGEMLANVLATFAQYERRLISQRTKDALAIKKSQGIKLGRPKSITPEIEARIRGMREAGMSLRAICKALEADGVPPPRGKAWYPTSFSRAL